MTSRIPRTPSEPHEWDDFALSITGSLCRTGYSAVMDLEWEARAMAKLGATHEERMAGERALSIIMECLDDRERRRG